MFGVASLLIAQISAPWLNPHTEETLPRDFGCLSQSELRNDMHPSELARIVRACAEDQRYDDAIQVYYTYSSYGLFDQQRVRDESAHVVLPELSQWMFAFLDRPTMTGVRASIDKMRDPKHPFFVETCGNIFALGPPDYRPGYMIRYGMIPRKSANDWQHEVFDTDAAWHKAVVEINKCDLERHTFSR
ncbi:hypothetical protein [Planktotalea sp.]|uniref:hypothetical protein n=1 Tax=Planktotalea sp. TaxID=2029877 RepID=UPI0032970CEE